MAITNPFTITYGTRAIGGSSNTYLLHGPYTLEKTFGGIRVAFDVMVVGTSYDTDSNGLQQLSLALEDDFRKRDKNLVINLDGTSWTYTSGTTILNTSASIQKSGDDETDRGFSRMYTVVITGDLPADDGSPVTGLQDIEVNVDYQAGRQKVITIKGAYTATSTRKALANYNHSTGADAEATTILAAIDNIATFELVDENFDRDRNDHTVTFMRQYNELLVNQTAAALDSPYIRDHRVTFTDISSHTGDSRGFTYKFRRVAASYDCQMDIVTTAAADPEITLQTLYSEHVKAHINALFEANFKPSVFCVETSSVTYNEAQASLSVSITFLYQSMNGGSTVEVTESLAFRESRHIDYTPLHDGWELTAVADPGFAVLERVASRTVTIVGTESPKRRLGVNPDIGPAGEIRGIEGGRYVKQKGWNITSNTSEVSKRFLGDPDFVGTGASGQISISTLTESVTEQFTSRNVNK